MLMLISLVLCLLHKCEPGFRILDSQTHFKSAETFQYTHFSSCQPFITEEGFIKGEALCLLTNQVKEDFGMYKRFSLNTGISFNSNLDLHIFLTSHRLYLTGRKKSLKDVLGPVHTKTIVNANASKHIFLSPSTRKRSSFT